MSNKTIAWCVVVLLAITVGVFFINVNLAKSLPSDTHVKTHTQNADTATTIMYGGTGIGLASTEANSHFYNAVVYFKVIPQGVYIDGDTVMKRPVIEGSVFVPLFRGVKVMNYSDLKEEISRRYPDVCMCDVVIINTIPQGLIFLNVPYPAR